MLGLHSLLLSRVGFPRPKWVSLQHSQSPSCIWGKEKTECGKRGNEGQWRETKYVRNLYSAKVKTESRHN